MICDRCRFNWCKSLGLSRSEVFCSEYEPKKRLKRKIKMKKEDFKIDKVDCDDCGWYIVTVTGKDQYLHKDLKLHCSTGFRNTWNPTWQWGEAPGYYPTKEIAQEYLNEYFRKNIERKTMIKKGDKVLLNDSSYSVIIGDKGFVPSGDVWPIRGACKDVWKVLAIECCLPAADGDLTNNTIIQSITTGNTMFTCVRFLKLVTHTIEFDGKKFEMSDESYNNFKRQFLND